MKYGCQTILLISSSVIYQYQSASIDNQVHTLCHTICRMIRFFPIVEATKQSWYLS